MPEQSLEAWTADGGVVFRVHVQPRASCNEAAGLFGRALRLRVAAPPQDGRATEACLMFIARALGVPRQRVSLVAGRASRSKVVRVQGMKVEAVARAFAVRVQPRDEAGLP